MGIELPRELAALAAETGLSWPDADEDRLREQASAWRDAHRELTALAAEADQQAGTAVAALSRDAGEAAGQAWSAFVDPENGHLTVAARGAAEAADRLENAAEQVGAAKVELVRQLVEAAKNRDASLAAAENGHPTAILGVEPILRGTAANLAVVTHGLAATLGPAPVGSLVTPLVEPNPGARTPDGQGALLGVVTGLAPELVAPVVTPSPAVLGSAPPSVPSVPSAVASAVLTPPVVPPVVPEPAFADTDTGPIQLPDPPTPPSLPQYEGLLDSGGFDEVPTPSTGLPNGTVAAGFADAAVPPVGMPGMPGLPAAPAPAAGYAPAAPAAGYAAPFAPQAPAPPQAPVAPVAPGPRQPYQPYPEPAPARAGADGRAAAGTGNDRRVVPGPHVPDRSPARGHRQAGAAAARAAVRGRLRAGPAVPAARPPALRPDPHRRRAREGPGRVRPPSVARRHTPGRGARRVRPAGRSARTRLGPPVPRREAPRGAGVRVAARRAVPRGRHRGG
ncbi:WXG100-like domain-containing protein [Amycolatopsis thermoflava]|uniref:WXG100-like domain-containing protein n=1 Tax=Amycolatopsis thermoflava TaxID=84480 RepID=UPI000406462B|nr:hypothetical protein [Amycolatopsis thermoflava]